MAVRFAGRVGDIAPFRVMTLLDRGLALAKAGHDVIHMELGEPDFGTPEPIIDAGRHAFDIGATRYTSALGLPELRQRIADFYAVRLGTPVTADRVVVTAGASGALTLLTALLVGPGDGVLMTDPGYPCNRHFVTAFNGRPQVVPVNAECGFQLDAKTVAAHWESHTRGVLLASPANPSGAVIDADEMSAIAKTVAERDGWLVVDEIYSGLAYGAPLTPAFALDPDIATVNSFSKYFYMTGWRLGWLVLPESFVPEVEKLAQHMFICPSAVAQHAAIAAFDREVLDELERRREVMRERRDFFVGGLRQLGFVVEPLPQGAFYVYARLPEGVPDAVVFCERLLERHHVASTPGDDFGESDAQRYVRFTFALDLPRLEEALRRVAECMAGFG